MPLGQLVLLRQQVPVLVQVLPRQLVQVLVLLRQLVLVLVLVRQLVQVLAQPYPPPSRAG